MIATNALLYVFPVLQLLIILLFLSVLYSMEGVPTWPLYVFSIRPRMYVHMCDVLGEYRYWYPKKDRLNLLSSPSSPNQPP
jgi:hypothetical protein